jgi:uncharacterized protein YutE (UPF0331/DUF86 family)
MSKIPTKKEYLDKLRNDKQYASLIKKIETKEERQQILARVEYFAATMFDAVAMALSNVKQDPEGAKKISEALKTGDNIIKENSGEPLVSGSKG